MPAETPNRPVTHSASARSRSAQQHDEATRQVSFDAAERALSAADDDAGTAPVNRSLLSIFSSTATSMGGGVVGGDQRLSDSLHGVQPQSARDVDLETAVSASSTASTVALPLSSPSPPPSPYCRINTTALDSAATTVLLLSSPSSGPRRETGVPALPHASNSCPLDTGATNAAAGIGHLCLPAVCPYLPTSLPCLPLTSRAGECRCVTVTFSAGATAPLQLCCAH
jgi:hypothetical protein